MQYVCILLTRRNFFSNRQHLKCKSYVVILKSVFNFYYISYILPYISYISTTFLLINSGACMLKNAEYYSKHYFQVEKRINYSNKNNLVCSFGISK